MLWVVIISLHADYYERNRTNTIEKEHLYKRLQAIVEHPNGTIKRQWRYSYILPRKGINRASADVGPMFIACNLRKTKNILTMNVLKEYLRILSSLFPVISDLMRAILSSFLRINNPGQIFNSNKSRLCKTS